MLAFLGTALGLAKTKTGISVIGVAVVGLMAFAIWSYHSHQAKTIGKLNERVAVLTKENQTLTISNDTLATYVDDLRRNFEIQVDTISDFWRQMVDLGVPEAKIRRLIDETNVDDLQKDIKDIEAAVNAIQADIKDCTEAAANGRPPKPGNKVCG